MEDWKERLNNLFLVKFSRESSIKANNKKEQPVADILEKVKNSHIQELEDFILQEIKEAREGGYQQGLIENLDKRKSEGGLTILESIILNLTSTRKTKEETPRKKQNSKILGEENE